MSCFILEKKEYKKLYFQQYYESHKEEIIQRSTEWKKQNRSKHKTRQTLYCKQYYKRMKQQQLDKRVNYVDTNDLVFADYFD